MYYLICGAAADAARSSTPTFVKNVAGDNVVHVLWTWSARFPKVIDDEKVEVEVASDVRVWQMRARSGDVAGQGRSRSIVRARRADRAANPYSRNRTTKADA